MPGVDQLPESLSTRQAASVLGIHPKTLLRWDAQGRLSALRVGPRGVRRYARRDVLRLAQSQDTRVREAQRGVVEVARAISGSLDLEAVARTVVEAAVRVVGSDRCAVYLLDDERTLLEPLCVIDRGDTAQAEAFARIFYSTPLPIDAMPLFRHTLAHPEAIVVEDAATHPLVSGPLSESFDIRTFISIGLRGPDGQVFALMPFAWTDGPRELLADDLFLAQSLAALAEVALSNARLFAQRERERARATIINAVVRDVNSGRDLSDTLTRAIGSMVEQLGADEGAIWLTSADGLAVIGAAETRTHGQTRIGATLPLAASPNLARAVERQQPLIVPFDQALGAEQGWFSALGVQAALYVPLLSQGRFVGMAFVNYLQRAPLLRAADLEFVGMLAAQCALAIERAQLLERASSRAAELEAVISQMGEGVIVADDQGRVTLSNRYAATLHGADLLGTIYGDAPGYRLCRRDGSPLPPAELPLNRAVLRGETVANAEWCICRDQQRRIIVSGSASPILGADGARLGAVLVLQDVTARRRLEEEKDQFLSIVSHELKTPLTTIKGLSDLARRRLTRGAPAEDVLRNLQTVARQVQRMEELLEDVLNIQRLETGKLPLTRRTIDLVPLVQDAAERARAMTDRHTIAVLTQPDTPLYVWADRSRIEQVLDNLLTNAIKYSPNAGAIRLELSRADEEAVLLIHDQGIGIPDAGRERLFERFYRGVNAVDGQYSGLGIGLALSREIMQRHGGTLTLVATTAAGSTFRASLPLAGDAG